jgi:hypothetical protein
MSEFEFWLICAELFLAAWSVGGMFAGLTTALVIVARLADEKGQALRRSNEERMDLSLRLAQTQRRLSLLKEQIEVLNEQ